MEDQVGVYYCSSTSSREPTREHHKQLKSNCVGQDFELRGFDEL